MKDFSNLYGDEYFKNRKHNDLKRLSSFNQEKLLITQYVDLDSAVCDIGCSTGEFLTAIDWRGPRFGMEVNVEAVNLAKTSGISFEKNILNSTNFFDVVIFRGTIQHIPDPFRYIEQAYKALKDDGYIFFLATPNANSIVYKLFNTLPVLDPKLNFFIPSDITLSNVLDNFDFEVIKIERPYLDSAYSNFIKDHINFLKSFMTGAKPSFPFWRNMMNVVARKKKNEL